MPRRVEATVMATADPSGLIAETARLLRRRYRLDLLLPAVPPACAALVAWMTGRLPVEILAASAIALGTLLMHVASLEVASLKAAIFLDRSLAAKEHFLTLATVAGSAPLRSVVEARARVIAGRGGSRIPPQSPRPLVISAALSTLFLLLLWTIPLAPAGAPTGEPLEQIAADLAASVDAADRELAATLREVLRVLRDPRRSNQEKRAAVDKAMAAIERKAAGSSSTGASSGKGNSGESGGKQQGAGAGGSGNDARGQAQQRLTELGGELSAESPSKSSTGQAEKQQPSGGGIKGPKDGAEQRKPSEQEAAGNQPGKNPQQQGGAQASHAESGQSQSQAGNEPQPSPNDQTGQSRSPQSPGEGIGQHTSQGPDKRAERYYKPGEGPDGAAVDGRYVRMRVPEDGGTLPGSEEVAKPGDVSPQVGYGNAPLPPPGSPGEVSSEQPVPLEYRRVLAPSSAAR